MRKENNTDTVNKLRPIDDLLFSLIYENKEACQELIRTLLSDDSLVVDEVTAQKTITNLIGRSVRLDVLCRSTEK